MQGNLQWIHYQQLQQRTWVIKTVKSPSENKYIATLSNTFKVSGDEFYLDGGAPTLPLGTITVEETKGASRLYATE